jgi:hypothetical protein
VESIPSTTGILTRRRKVSCKLNQSQVKERDAYHVYSVALSEKGWTSNFIGTQWFEKCFVPQATARNLSGKPILLIYDGHRSHETIELREAADKAEIHLFCIPPHTSHCLQPLDVGIFGPLQRAWQNRCLAVLEETGKSITRENVVKEYMIARTKSVTTQVIVSAWRRPGICPLNAEVFTKEDFAPSYSSSTSPPLPVSFPGFNDPESLCPSSEGVVEGIDLENPMSIDELGSNVARGSSSLNQVLNQEVTYNLPLSVQPSAPSPPFNEARDILHQEGRTEPPDQSGAHRRMPTHLPPVNLVNIPHRQTRSVSRSLSRSTSIMQSAAVSLEHVKALEEQLRDTQERLKDTQESVDKLKSTSEEWKTHCHFMYGVVSQLQNQLQAKEKKKGTHAKRTQVEARVLTSEEGRLELQQLREEARLKEQRQIEETTRKATEDEARRKRRADCSRVFTGALNKARRKEELEDIAAALALPDSGKKEELLDRITNHFEEHPDLKTNLRFEGLFNPRPRKCARLNDTPAPVAGPSTIHEPALPPPAFPPSVPPFAFGTFGPGPASTPYGSPNPLPNPPYYFNAFHYTQ